jgi:hypothetical protein
MLSFFFLISIFPTAVIAVSIKFILTAFLNPWYWAAKNVLSFVK